MAVVKIRWTVQELANVMTQFDTQKVYRSTTGESGPYSEITDALTRVDLVADQTDYYFDDTTGSSAYWYRIAYYHSVSTLEGSMSDPIPATGTGLYVSLQDVRDEGFSATEYSDARVLRMIRKAEAWFERTTNRWFYPRNITNLRVSGTSNRFLQLYIPIIRIDEVAALSSDWPEDDEENVIDLSSIKVYNRHLTMGLTKDDDRQDPKLILDPDSYWPPGHQNIKVSGWFGYTELAPGDSIGETDTGSQIPLSTGQTPPDIVEAILRLVARELPLKSDPDEGDFWTQRHRVTRWKTRDQEIQLASPKAAGTPVGGFTGDSMIDDIIAQFMAPATARMV